MLLQEPGNPILESCDGFIWSRRETFASVVVVVVVNMMPLPISAVRTG